MAKKTHANKPAASKTEVKAEEMTNGLAITALVMGILAILLGWIPFLGTLIGLTGITLGIVALVQINKSKERGKALAIVGLVLSAVGTLVWLILLISIVTYFAGFAQYV